MTDEQIQRILDEGSAVSLPDSAETAGYRKLYEYLDHPEGFTPRNGFAHRVTALLDKKTEKALSPVLIAFISLAAVMLLASVAVLFIFFDLTLEINQMTISLVVMFVLGSIITALYRVIEIRYLRH